MKSSVYIENFETFKKINESRQKVDWLKPIFDEFLRELDSYFVKNTEGKWTIIRDDSSYAHMGKTEETTVVMTSGSVSTYDFGEEENESWFLIEVVENKMFRVEITPIFRDPHSSQDKPFTFSDFFNITYNAQGYRYLPSFQFNRTFARTAGNKLKKSEVEKFYGEVVWFLTGGTAPPKRLKEEYDRILDMFKNAPVLDLTNYVGRLTGRKYGL